MEARALILDGLKHALTVRTFWLYLFVSFIGRGIFNGLTTWIEGIVRPRGFTPTHAGTLGALLLVGGDHLPHAGGNLERPEPALWAGLRDFRLYHGRA
jgi:hypothetical protein